MPCNDQHRNSRPGERSPIPTPRWTLAATIAAVAIAALITAVAGPGNGEDMVPVQLGVGLTTSVAGIVLGAWMIGLEYGQKTIRRALTADPRRPRLVLAKLAAVLGAVTVMTVGLFAVSAPVFSAIASAHGESIPIGETLEYGLAGLFNNLLYTTVAFSLTLATRSMAGGVALALVFTFVIDSASPRPDQRRAATCHLVPRSLTAPPAPTRRPCAARNVAG